MGPTYWLIDKSALVRLSQSPDSADWVSRIGRGLVRISTLSRLEIGFSARTATEAAHVQIRPPVAAMPVEYLTPAVEDRAVEVQQMLAQRGQHRSAWVPDLLIAATAELAGLTVLHVDKDFELIAAITGQPIERLELTTA